MYFFESSLWIWCVCFRLWWLWTQFRYERALERPKAVGEPSEACLRRDILTIYDHVFHLIQKNIYLYGESSILSPVSLWSLVGSYPCCFLATQKGVHIQGIVLHSAVVSGMSSFLPPFSIADHILRVSCLPNRCDSFNNLKLASKIHVCFSSIFLFFFFRFPSFKFMESKTIWFL